MSTLYFLTSVLAIDRLSIELVAFFLCLLFDIFHL